MNLPRQYLYTPKTTVILFSLGSGVVWLGLQALICQCRPHGFSLWFGWTPIILGLLLAVRRLAFTRFLVLDTHAIILPTGLVRVILGRFHTTAS